MKLYLRMLCHVQSTEDRILIPLHCFKSYEWKGHRRPLSLLLSHDDYVVLWHNKKQTGTALSAINILHIEVIPYSHKGSSDINRTYYKITVFFLINTCFFTYSPCTSIHSLHPLGTFILPLLKRSSDSSSSHHCSSIYIWTADVYY
jgi:hypothetical protein